MNKPVEIKRKHLLVLYVSMILTIAFALAFSALTTRTYIHSQEEQAKASRKPTCELLVAFEEGYQENPPATSAGKRQQQAIHEMIVRFGCNG